MARIYPDLENIQRLKVQPTDGEWCLVNYLNEHLDDDYELYFNPFLDGDRPDIVLLREGCGIHIIEVKDWKLDGYKIDEKNKWMFFDGVRYCVKGSPQAQAFRYKKNMYELHMPVVGLARLTNPNFYNLVHCFVFFHGSTNEDISNLYAPAESHLRDKQNELNERIRNKRIDFDAYEKNINYLERTRRKIQRDRAMAYGDDRLSSLVKKIKQKSSHMLFDERVYRDFKRRLGPSEHVLNQGIAITLDKRQASLAQSSPEKRKIKGVAGCGKTAILARRAISARERHETQVLILTFNITLKNHIRDKVSDFLGRRDFEFLEISNYHQFFTAQMNNAGKDIPYLIEVYGFEKLYSTDIFEEDVLPRYKTILIDEVQDYEQEWVKIIRDNFLTVDGEMILFGDESQNIYNRDDGSQASMRLGFGAWIKLKRSYRTGMDSPLNQLYKDYQLNFLVSKYTDSEVIEVAPEQIGLGFSLLRYELFQEDAWEEPVSESIQGYIESYDINPDEVVVLCSRTYHVRRLNEYWLKKEKTVCMIESYEELAVALNRNARELKRLSEAEINECINSCKGEVDKIRRTKKNHFHSHSGLIKFSTTHSFKGLEAKYVFYILTAGDEPEVVYTSITRSSENLIVLDIGGKSTSSRFMEERIGGR